MLRRNLSWNEINGSATDTINDSNSIERMDEFFVRSFLNH